MLWITTKEIPSLTPIFAHCLVASLRALNQPLNMFWCVLYHQRCTQQCHVLTAPLLCLTHLVSQTVRTTKSCFDASCVTRSAHTKVTFWLVGIVLYHQCTEQTHATGYLYICSKKLCHPGWLTHARFMVAHHQQGLFVNMWGVPRQSFKFGPRKTKLLEKMSFFLYLCLSCPSYFVLM